MSPENNALRCASIVSLASLRSVVNACRGAGFEPRAVEEAAHMQTIVGLVAAGAGVSLVPTSVA